MERRTMGRTGMQASVLGFGGAEIGAMDDLGQVERVLNEALDNGVNVIDTAECYGQSEAHIGKVLCGGGEPGKCGRRDEFLLFTKCGHAAGLNLPDWDPRMLAMSIDRSLTRLNTDRVDLIQLHSCTEEALRQGDVVAVLLKARDAGKTRFVGYSGDGAAARFAVESGAFDVLQTSVSVMDQESLSTTIPAATERGMGIIAKRPLANAVWRYPELPDETYHQEYWRRMRELDYGFLREPPELAAGIALRFTLWAQRQGETGGVHTAIVGTTRPGRIIENVAAAQRGPLPTDVMESILSRWREVAGPDWVGQV